jgi:dTDP-4-dehydrorhamnose reductase
VRAAVVGAHGQLGRALVECLGAQVVWSGGRESLDVCDAAAVTQMVERERPDVLFNAAAYNAVDVAESDPAAALAVNATAPRHLAAAARRIGARFVHVSTDYVFDGTASRPYREDDAPRPINVYGASKLAGETIVSATGGDFLVVRTSGVLGLGASRAKGGSFVERVVAQARAGAPLRVVADQTFSPTYAPDLAQALLALVAANARGLYHVTNDGACSWHELAEAALKAAGIDASIEKIRAQDLARPAARPAYSVLSNERYRSLELPALRPWRDALQAMLA